MVDVAVVGAAGYAGVETARWVLAHPQLSLTCVTSTADAGNRLAALYPALEGVTDLVFTVPDVVAIAQSAQVAFLAVPHTAALEMTPGLLDRGVKVLDLSADFRLSDADAYEQWYATPHTQPHLLAEAVYGLPELDRSRLAGARLVACPGCYPTATALAAAPALASGAASGTRVVVDAVSGVSGAGRAATATTHHVSVAESFCAYKVAAHRHTPEMEQSLSRAAGRPISVLFAPHLAPMSRGLHVTAYLDAADGLTTADAYALYRDRYADEPFVTVHEPGTLPSTGEVRGTNRAAIGLTVDGRTSTLVVMCAIDNLGKGAAGQAVQCLNAVLGLPETTGLDAVGPVV